MLAHERRPKIHKVNLFYEDTLEKQFIPNNTFRTRIQIPCKSRIIRPVISKNSTNSIMTNFGIISFQTRRINVHGRK